MSILESSALKVNLENTAAEVKIPDKYAPLIRSVKSYYGVHQRLIELLTELHHPFVNWEFVNESLKSFAIGEFEKFNAHPESLSVISIIFQIYFLIIESNCKQSTKAKTIKSIADFIRTIISKTDSNLKARIALSDSCFKQLSDICDDPLLLIASSSCKSLLKSNYSLLCHEFYHFWQFALNCFVSNYNFWLEQEDPEEWFNRDSDAGLTNEIDQTTEFERIEALKTLIKPLCHKNLSNISEQIFSFHKSFAAASNDFDPLARLLEATPDYQQILNAYLRVARNIENVKILAAHLYLIQIDYLFNILRSAALSEIHIEALRLISRLLAMVFAQEPYDKKPEFIQKIFRALSNLSTEKRFSTIVLDCTLTIAREVDVLNDKTLFEVLVGEIIKCGFQHPDVTGTNEEWQIQLNPDHIKNIRVWMQIIAMKPRWTRKLLSALVVNLKLGGVVIRDTDLFQRDISAYLNSDVSHNINLSKQLLRLFPAFYNEIGAEGELRDISTKADELCKRNDPLVHFIRKQTHVESNNLLVKFLEAAFYYWNSGNKQLLITYLPQDIYNRVQPAGEYFVGMHKAFRSIFQSFSDNLANLLVIEQKEISEVLSSLSDVTKRDKQRAECLVRMYQLLEKKYNPQPVGLISDLRKANRFDDEAIDKLAKAVNRDDHYQALDSVLTLLEQLQRKVLSVEQTHPVENIYFKRHIAAGIPSMYGVYREEKFDSAGLSFKLESFAKSLFDKLIDSIDIKFITKSTLMKIYDLLPLFLRAFDIEGIPSRQFSSKINYLKTGFSIKLFSIDQYLDIFLGISKSIQSIIKNYYIDAHKNALETVIMQMSSNNHTDISFSEQDYKERLFSCSESFLRDLLSSAFGLQTLDNLITRIIDILRRELGNFKNKKAMLNLVTTYNPDITVSNIHNVQPAIDNAILLGNKGYWLKRLSSFGFNIPPGFVLTTEIYRCFDAVIGYKTMLKDLGQRILKAVCEIENATGRKFGDPDNPLLLSVRSGAAISMPGMMDTFLNVGINKHICEKVSQNPKFEWTIWDSYRRFLQMWGMNSGLERNFFDNIINDYKAKFKAAKKIHLSPLQMKEIALAYRKATQSHGIKIFDNPEDQLRYAILKTFQSWNSDCARIYRKQMNISDDWGTAVVVQSMVFGNFHERSGSGVTFTRDPNSQDNEIQLFGDFYFGVQGDDIVSGLIETRPVSETQRIKEKRHQQSLETKFPQIYQQLLDYAKVLITEKGFNHQEIEFTFEGPESNELFILQTRDQYVEFHQEEIITFIETPLLIESLLGNGTGVGDGIVSGRAVFNEKDIRKYRKSEPETNLILIRPDTVPEDVRLLLQVDGLLTARGGRTSHAAVTIPQLKKVGVVGFSKLSVFEEDSYCKVGTTKIYTGDYLSIDGWTGSVYKGKHETSLN